MTEQTNKKYRAFISYSHSDKNWGQWLHRAIETYRVPRRLVGRVTSEGSIPHRLMPLFRDRDELASSSDLGNVLHQALEESDWLLVVCSPQAAASEWVSEEIRTFIRLGRAERILALIVAGEPFASDPAQDCFPKPLRGTDRETKEPLAADTRKGGDGKSNARLKIVASMIGVGFDELRQREAHRRKQRLLALLLIVCTVLGLLGWFGLKVRDEAEAGKKSHYMNTIAQAQLALRTYDVPKAHALLAAAPVDLRAWEWHHLFYLADTSVATLEGHAAAVHQLYPSRDGTRITSHSADNAVRHWDVDQQREVSGILLAASASEQRCAWTDGTTIQLLDAATGSILVRWHASGTDLHQGRVNAVAVAPDGNRVASVGEDGTLRIWDPTRGGLLITRTITAKALRSVAYSPNGELLAVGGRDGLLKFLTPDGQNKRSLPGQEADILALSFSPDGRRLLSGDAAGLVLVWDLFKPVAVLRGHQGAINALGFRRDGEQVATGGEDGTLRIWDDALGIELKQMQGHAGAVHTLAYLADGVLIATGGADGTLKIWAADPQRDGTPENTPFPDQAINPSSADSIRVQKEGSLVHLLRGDTVISTLRGHSDRVTAVAVTGSGLRILTASQDGTLRLWSMADGQQILTVADNLPDIVSLTFNADDKSAVAVFESGHSRTWPVMPVSPKHSASLQEPNDRFSRRMSEAGVFAGEKRYLDALIALEEALLVHPDDLEVKKQYVQYEEALLHLRAENRAVEKGVKAQQALAVLEPLEPIITFNERDSHKPVTKIVFQLSRSSDTLTDDVLSHLQAFPELRELRFDGMRRLTDEGLRHIGRIASLETLALIENRNFTDEGLRHLAGLENLHVLELASTTLSGKGLVHLTHLPVRELYFRDVGYFDSRGKRSYDLTAVGSMTALEVLDLPGSHLTDENMTAIGRLKKLRRLDLESLHVSDTAMAHLGGLHELEVLNLNGSGISNNGLRVLGSLQKLHTLRLESVGMSGESATQHIGRLVNLRYLDIRQNHKLTDEALAPLAKLHQLEVLKLGSLSAHYWVTDATMDHIAHLTQLRKLSLFGLLNITDTGIKRLGGLKQLEWLDIGYTKVTVAGLSVLEELPRLRTLRLYNAKVKFEDQEAIEAKYPRLLLDRFNETDD